MWAGHARAARVHAQLIFVNSNMKRSGLSCAAAVQTGACKFMLMTYRIMQVYFGVKGGALTQTAVAKSDTYTAAEMCGIIANSSGYIYPGASPNWDWVGCELARCRFQSCVCRCAMGLSSHSRASVSSSVIFAVSSAAFNACAMLVEQSSLPALILIQSCLCCAGLFHTAYMNNLKPYTEYEYYVGASAPSALRC